MEPNNQPMYAPVSEPDAQLAPALPETAPDTSDETAPSPDDPIHWSASEFIQAEKGTIWFVIFGIVCAVLIATDILIFKSYTFSVLVAVIAFTIIFFAKRPPRDIQYTLSGQQGLYIGDELRHYSDFKSFGYIEDEGSHSIVLIPIKRFSPAVSIYFPEEVGEKIVDILGARLPMEDLKLDLIDKIVRKLRI
ncbi:MAG: hypothetical protein WCP11_00620 [Candidatus Saccharibacteria bacterium]